MNNIHNKRRVHNELQEENYKKILSGKAITNQQSVFFFFFKKYLELSLKKVSHNRQERYH